MANWRHWNKPTLGRKRSKNELTHVGWHGWSKVFPLIYLKISLTKSDFPINMHTFDAYIIMYLLCTSMYAYIMCVLNTYTYIMYQVHVTCVLWIHMRIYIRCVHTLYINIHYIHSLINMDAGLSEKHSFAPVINFVGESKTRHENVIGNVCF